MEGCVEYAYLGQTRHQLLNGVNALKVGWVVQRSKVRAFLESLQDLVSKDHRLIELLTAMHHTMTYCVNLIETLDYTDLRVSEQRKDKLHALSMLGDIVHNLLLLSIGQLYLYESSVQADALGTTTCHYRLVVHIVQCVLDRGRTTIQLKNMT